MALSAGSEPDPVPDSYVTPKMNQQQDSANTVPDSPVKSDADQSQENILRQFQQWDEVLEVQQGNIKIPTIFLNQLYNSPITAPLMNI